MRTVFALQVAHLDLISGIPQGPLGLPGMLVLSTEPELNPECHQVAQTPKKIKVTLGHKCIVSLVLRGIALPRNREPCCPGHPPPLTPPCSIHKLRENVFQEHKSLKEKELETGPKASRGYGGKFGVEQDRMDKVGPGERMGPPHRSSWRCGRCLARVRCWGSLLPEEGDGGESAPGLGFHHSQTAGPVAPPMRLSRQLELQE